MPENPINAENFGLEGLPDKLSGEWTEEPVNINTMIMDAAVRFGHASKAERISIAIQCGALATEATAESAVCPAELITLWGSALRDIEVEVRQAALFGLYLSTPPKAHKFASEIRRVAVGIDDSSSKTKRSMDCPGAGSEMAEERHVVVVVTELAPD